MRNFFDLSPHISATEFIFTIIIIIICVICASVLTYIFVILLYRFLRKIYIKLYTYCYPHKTAIIIPFEIAKETNEPTNSVAINVEVINPIVVS